MFMCDVTQCHCSSVGAHFLLAAQLSKFHREESNANPSKCSNRLKMLSLEKSGYLPYVTVSTHSQRILSPAACGEMLHNLNNISDFCYLQPVNTLGQIYLDRPAETSSLGHRTSLHTASTNIVGQAFPTSFKCFEHEIDENLLYICNSSALVSDSQQQLKILSKRRCRSERNLGSWGGT